jgi:GxxExxY protein
MSADSISGENFGWVGGLFIRPRMNANERESAVEKLIGAVYEVSNVLGAGFLEKVYERALLRELSLAGLQAQAQVRFPVMYKGKCVGEYLSDIIVEKEIVVELKCVESFTNEHLAQCINYLKATNLKLAFLVNFQKPKVEWKRIVYNL